MKKKREGLREGGGGVTIEGEEDLVIAWTRHIGDIGQERLRLEEI